MIKVLFPPGCYGTYLTRCIYNYSNLRDNEFLPFTFDKHGSSHQYRDNKTARLKIQCGHVDNLIIHHNDTVIALLPDNNSKLDYYNNQFSKQQSNQLVEYISNQFSIDEIDIKLKKHWNYTGKFDSNVPKWIIREWSSFWIFDLLENSYNRYNYSIPGAVVIEVRDILNNINTTLDTIFNHLLLTFTVDRDTISKTHEHFLQVQQYHQSQHRCQQFVESTITKTPYINTHIRTIFDESYIQRLFRDNGYEIRCEGLTDFPDSSLEMKKLIYSV